MSRTFRVLLELTTSDGVTVFVSPPHVRFVAPDEKGARVVFCEGESLAVRQRPEDVASRIDRWISAAYLGER